MLIKNKISDPLKEKILPEIFQTLNYNHHSPTSLDMLDGPFVFQITWMKEYDYRSSRGRFAQTS